MKGLLGSDCKAFPTFKRMVWMDNPTASEFNLIVCHIIFIVSTVADFPKFLNPIMIEQAGSIIGKFLQSMKDIYALVCHLALS